MGSSCARIVVMVAKAVVQPMPCLIKIRSGLDASARDMFGGGGYAACVDNQPLSPLPIAHWNNSWPSVVKTGNLRHSRLSRWTVSLSILSAGREPRSLRTLLLWMMKSRVPDFSLGLEAIILQNSQFELFLSTEARGLEIE
ncbi:hypothetical protein COCCADRAFT_31445 [Bipolaris zeicola 26-R-13]|uniref:Uncharacterized protein n=1 Tax=Cochliobolus carbonum (strain 26-R-13) TaxID=930089 RepID=W6XII6_COCC2|nr:uncharacterized protein COCCADRAFT_31445 [Bipolaris zeicola 26-R-13]EUC26912.1 hypothetical protein COCCADRAFT_31445 [Bipolaris zeicola 26-R-13]